MEISRRTVLKGLLATSASTFPGLHATSHTFPQLRIAHQFPSAQTGFHDFRDRLCRRFASELAKRSHGELTAAVYADARLVPPLQAFHALETGSIEMSLIPLIYAGEHMVECNIAMLPGLVTRHEQANHWKDSDAGRLLTHLMAERGIIMLSWIWLAGGAVSRKSPLIVPQDAKGMLVRGGSRAVNLMLKAAGAEVAYLSSNAIHDALRSQQLDAAMTTSTSIMSFRLQDVSSNLVTGRGNTYWFTLEALAISRKVFDRLSKKQQGMLFELGNDLEVFARESAQADDYAAALFAKNHKPVFNLTQDHVRQWQEIARETAWKDFASRSNNCAQLLTLARQLL